MSTIHIVYNKVGVGKPNFSGVSIIIYMHGYFLYYIVEKTAAVLKAVSPSMKFTGQDVLALTLTAIVSPALTGVT